MAFTLSATLGLTGNGSLNLGAGASGRTDLLNLGQNGLLCSPVGFVNGTVGTLDASNNLKGANWYLNTLVINAGSQYDFCFSGGADKDPSGVALALTKVSLVFLAITAIAGVTLAPNGADFLQIGPDGVANTAALWFGATTANVFEKVYWQSFHPGPAAGWTVNSTTASLMRIKNPGANNITCALLVIGS